MLTLASHSVQPVHHNHRWDLAWACGETSRTVWACLGNSFNYRGFCWSWRRWHHPLRLAWCLFRAERSCLSVFGRAVPSRCRRVLPILRETEWGPVLSRFPPKATAWAGLQLLGRWKNRSDQQVCIKVRSDFGDLFRFVFFKRDQSWTFID